MRLRTIAFWLLSAAAGLAARPAAASDQILLTPAPASLNPGATTQLQISVQLDTVPFGGYLFTINYDTRALSLVSLGQVQTGEFQDEFYQGPGSAAGSFTFQGLNDKSLLTPTGSANLAIAVFQAARSTAVFAGIGILSSTVTVTAREGVSTGGAPVKVFSSAANFQVIGDTIAPVTTISFNPPSSASDPQGRPILSTSALVGLTASDPLSSSGFGSGVAFTGYAVDPSTTPPALTPYTAPFALAIGTHTIVYGSRDNAGNAEVLRSTQVFVGSPDTTPPVTALVLTGPQFIGAAGQLFASTSTLFGFSAYDPAVGPFPPSGVAQTQYRVDAATPTAPFTAFVSSFTLPEGSHVIDYRSVDRAGNVEVVHSSMVKVDATSPVTQLAFSSAPYVDASSRTFVSASDLAVFIATDPISNGVASGVAFTQYRINQSTFTRYSAPFALPEGIDRLDFQSQDNVQNVELLKSATVYSDATPPVTTLSIGQPQFVSSGTVFVSTMTPFALSSQDPLSNGVGSGVSTVSVRLDGNAFSAYSATFTISTPDGARSVSWFAADNVGNQEAIKVSTVSLDATAPVSSLVVLSGRQFPAGTGAFYASSGTYLAFLSTDPVVGGVASGVAFTRYQDNGGAFSVYTASFTLAEGSHQLVYQSQDNVSNIEVARSTTVLIDATPPVSTATIGSPMFTGADGTIYVSTTTPITFSAADPPLPQPSSGPVVAGSGVNHLEIAVDTTAFSVYSASVTLAEGRHTILYRSVDNVGNVEVAKTLNVQSDGTPPVSQLSIGSPQYQLPNVLLVSSRTPFGISAVDPVSNNVASGVKDSWYYLSDVVASTTAFMQFTASFTLSGLDVNKVVQFYSRDNVLNSEVVKSSTVLLDSTPPEISLLSPAACDSGICHVVKGKVPVLGTARDLHFAGYVLESAAGQDATNGFITISSAVVAVSSGTLGLWDATKLAGWQTLRLTGTDLVQNVSVLTINIWVGDPADLMELGNHDVFNLPTGVAVSSSGAVYVADRDNDRIAVFSSTGALLASFGSPRGREDDDKVSTGTLRLNKPSAVAVDGAGNIYVADTNDNRALKLSPAGQVLLAIGRLKRDRDDGKTKAEFAPGKGPGEFNKPQGVAVDAAQNIYVADTENHRVEVFSSTGAFELQISLPAIAQRKDGDHKEDEKGDDDAAASLGKPVGIALDAAGKIYVADPKGHRALAFGATGQFLLTIPIVGDKPEQVGQPMGVAVSPSGDCLLVSDQKLARVVKFDFQGEQNLVFGAKGSHEDDKAPAIVFRKPAGLALDAAGNLYVADRNNERIKKFGLPTGQPTLIVPPPKPEDDQVARAVVDKDDGGKIQRKDGSSVAVPAQALANDLKISVSTPIVRDLLEENQKVKDLQDKGLKVAYAPVEYNPEGTQFGKPVTLQMPYDPKLVAAQGASEDNLKIQYWNRDKRQWEAYDSTVDKINHRVTAKTTHFSLYQVLGSSGTGGVGVAALTADPTFTLHAVYAFPNPAVGGAKPTIHVAVGLADQVTIKILNVAGQQVSHAELFSPSIIDDGTGPNYAYEWVWDGHIASGMYFYVVEAEKAGFPKIRKAGKLGVVR